MNETIGLGYVYDLLNFDEGTHEECLYKMAFLAFYRWYIKEKHSVHILKEGKILDKNKGIYLKEKNYMAYLPDLRVKAQKKLAEKRVKTDLKHEKNSESSESKEILHSNSAMDIE